MRSDDAMRFFLLVPAFEGLIGGLLFVSAGRWDLPWFWAVLAVHTSLMIVMVSVMDPDLRRERLRPGPGVRDCWFRKVVGPLMLVHLVVAGLDAGRFRWSGPVPAGVHALGLAGMAAGLGLSVWAMATNRFFSSVTRIQADRGHRVVTAGPYRVLRHPSYAGSIVGAACGGIALGSWWSLVPLVPFGLLFLWRTAMEDRMLREELEGYAGYAQRVRYRLMPGLW
jgi:protein-S-isoprenylcysteine O-methyltransferase Ste14